MHYSGRRGWGRFSSHFRHIDRVLDESDIVLAIVGPRWIGPDHEQRRLASPADPVRLEIETALRKDKPLIPVLVSRAAMPQPEIYFVSNTFGGGTCA